MQCAVVLFLALAFAPVHAEHPIAGVISLLQKLAAQSKEEGAAEAATFQKFTYWCKTSEKELTKSIATAKEDISTLTDKIDGLTADIATLGEDITELDTQIKTLTTAADKAKTVRDEENGLYKEEQKNFEDSVSAVDEAITVLQDSKASFLQTKAAVDKVELIAEAMGKPAAKTYTFKSGAIIETFKGMKAEFEADKLDSTSAETNKLNAYNLAKSARDRATKAAEDSKKEKEGIKADKEGELEKSGTDKSETEKSLSGDTATWEQTDKECKTVSGEWEERSKVRNGEITAMDMAIKILGKVTGTRNPDEHEIPSKALITASSHVNTAAFPADEQDESDKKLMVAIARVERNSAKYRRDTTGLSFLQIEDPKTKAVNLLKKAAAAAKSKSLQKLAEHISTFDGPFDKIKAMIQKMIFQLMGEQKDEDEHKNWCDMETEKATESKADKDEKNQMFKKKIAEMDTQIKDLVQKISDNNHKVETIASYMETETQLRTENHAEIVATIKDSQEAQKAVTAAVQVLTDFYKESGMITKEPWEFVQIHSHKQTEKIPDKPDTWDSSYSGVSDPSGSDGVLGILDGVMQKFSAMEADAKVQDETDQQNYDADMQAKKIEKAETETDTKMKTSKKDSLQQKLEGTSEQLKSTTGEFDAVVQYLKDLEPACGAGDSSYEDRKKARADEIAALRKAQTILEDAFRAK